MGQFEDHLGVGIISEAVQVLEHSLLSTELYNDAPRRSLGTFAHWHTNNVTNLNKLRFFTYSPSYRFQLVVAASFFQKNSFALS